MMNLMFLLGILFMMGLQPIFMVSVLILVTLFYSYGIFVNMGSYWLSYVLLMVMLSGVMVVFMYMVTMMPNEKFEVYSVVVFLIFIGMFMMKYSEIMIEDMSIMTVNLWISYLGVVSLFLVGFLLMIMLLVVILSYLDDGAVRI